MSWWECDTLLFPLAVKIFQFRKKIIPSVRCPVLSKHNPNQLQRWRNIFPSGIFTCSCYPTVAILSCSKTFYGSLWQCNETHRTEVKLPFLFRKPKTKQASKFPTEIHVYGSSWSLSAAAALLPPPGGSLSSTACLTNSLQTARINTSNHANILPKILST